MSVIPRDFRGDLAAQIGAARLGEQRLTSVIAEVRCRDAGSIGRGDAECG